MRKVFTIACLLHVLLTSAFAQFAYENIEINQSGAPIVIEKVTGAFASSGRGLDCDSCNHQYDLKIKNISDKEIKGVRIGFVNFDHWNEVLNVLYGTRRRPIRPGKSVGDAWHFPASSESKGNTVLIDRDHRYPIFTSVAFVDKIRFDDGTFWYHDENFVIQELKKIQEDFDADKLQEKR